MYPDPDMLMRFVDPNKYLEFKSYFESYFQKVIEDKCLRLFEFIQRKTEKIKIKIINNIKNNDRDIFFEVHQIDIPRIKRRSMLCELNFFNCFNKKKQNKQIQTIINFETFKKEFDSLIDSIGNTPLNISSPLLVYELYLSKLSNMYSNNLESKLKDLVDNFYMYFNIDQIVIKQKGEIFKQRLKIESLDELKESTTCIVCYENERNVVFYPCKHLLCCSACIVRECPNCNSIIGEKLIISN
jgi:hypothetical protein